MVTAAVLHRSAIEPDNSSKVLQREKIAGLAESWGASLVLAALIALRIVYAFVYRIDSDEPQHLHVVWGWTQGMIQYRDIFDNHSPLFQMVCAPLMWALGEHAWIIVPMRLAMLPLYLADIGLMYLTGGALYTRRWGVWMAIVAGAAPLFFLVTTEFRTDDLWTTVWLTVVWLAVTRPLQGKQAFLFGLAVGACFAVSMKTTLLMLSMGTAGFGLLALHVLSRRRTNFPAGLKSAALIVAGAIIIPGLLIGFFATQGALHQMYYCVIQHNTVPGLGKWAKAGFHLWLFPISLPILLCLGWLCMHSSANEEIGAGRALLLMTFGAYYLLLRSYWPLVTAQDFIPVLPLLGMSVLPFIFHLLTLTNWPERFLMPAAGFLLVAGEVAWIWHDQSPLENYAASFEQNLAVILHLTDPTDFVMDGKGETIFRKRPVYWVYEGVTIRRMELGLIKDDIQQKIIQTGTCVALNHRLRSKDQLWLRDNFLEGNGKVWIAGKSLGAARPSIKFHTDIPGRYSIVAEKGSLSGTIDGVLLSPSQQIPAGDHELKITSASGQVAIVWSKALERGFSPFTKTLSGEND